jgi:hypothetical protein
MTNNRQLNEYIPYDIQILDRMKEEASQLHTSTSSNRSKAEGQAGNTHPIALYQAYFLPPSALYLFRDSSVLCMQFAELGTLVNAVTSLHGQKRPSLGFQFQFDAKEQETIVAYLAVQVQEEEGTTQIAAIA